MNSNKISKEMYKTIKRMNRSELQKYLLAICAQSYNEGVSDMANKMVERVELGIRNTPGIGEKRYNEILSSINRELTRDDKIEGDKID